MSLRILHTADLQIEDSQHLPDNLDRQFEAWDEIYKIALKYKVDYILNSGDLICNVNLSEEGRTRLQRKFIEYDNPEKYPKHFIISGNHDVYNDEQTMIRPFKDLAKLVLHNYEMVELKPKFIKVSKELSILAIPYRKGLTTKDFYRYVKKGHKKNDSKYFAVMAHFYAQGAVLANGYKKGGDVEFDKVLWDYLALGDAHEFQKMCKRGFYSGAPVQHKFGDKLPKGVIIYDLARHKHKFVAIDTPKIKKLIQLTEIPKKWPVNAWVDLKTKKDINVEKLPDSVIKSATVVEEQEVNTQKLDDITEGLPEYLADIGFDKKEQRRGVKLVNNITETLKPED